MALNRKLKTTFGKLGKLYSSARKGYSDKLFFDIVEISKIKKDAVILDIGCGTGLSIAPFAKKNYKVIGLDISKELLDIAKKELKNYSNVKFVNKSFEKAGFNSDSFDLIISGQTFHWLDPKIACENVARFLKKGGYLAVFAKFWKHRSSKFLLRVRKIVINHCPDFPVNLGYKPHARDRMREINDSGFFGKPIIKKYNLKFEYSKEQFRNLVLSYSWVGSLSNERRKDFLKELDKILKREKGSIVISYDNVLIMAKVKK